MSDPTQTRDTPPEWVIAMACDADRMRTWTDGQLRAIICCADDWQGGSLAWWADPEAWRG